MKAAVLKKRSCDRAPLSWRGEIPVYLPGKKPSIVRDLIATGRKRGYALSERAIKMSRKARKIR
jgi:hypothetical protein